MHERKRKTKNVMISRLRPFLKYNDKGSAAVEFVIEAAFIAILIMGMLQMFAMINNATQTVIAGRHRAFEMLEGIHDDANGCIHPAPEFVPDGFSRADPFLTFPVTGSPGNYIVWDRLFNNLTPRQVFTIWVGHKPC